MMWFNYFHAGGKLGESFSEILIKLSPAMVSATLCVCVFVYQIWSDYSRNSLPRPYGEERGLTASYSGKERKRTVKIALLHRGDDQNTMYLAQVLPVRGFERVSTKSF